MNRTAVPALSALTLALALTLTGCGEKAGEEAKVTQVVAKVGKDEITVHQLNFELGRLAGNLPANLTPEQRKQTANQVLRGLVDQQLLMQKAIEDKLDRDPKVVQTLESARRQVLAQAYLDKITSAAAKPTEQEIKDYYDKHPELFSERRIYRLQEIAVQVTPQNAAQVQEKIASVRNLDDFVAWLRENNIPARGVQSVKAAEQLPLEILPRLHAIKDGGAITLTGNNQVTLLVVAGSQMQPVSLQQATPAIERFLLNRKKRELAEAELKRLRDASKIEYLGEYKDAANVPAQAAKAVAEKPAEQTGSGLPELANPPVGQGVDQGASDRGVQGLR